jgi:hypothetical protein
MKNVHRRAAALFAAAALTVGAGSTQAATPKLEGQVLVGPKGADLIVILPPGTETVRKILVSIYSADPTAKPRNRTLLFSDVPVEDGRAVVDLGVVPRGSDVGFEARYGDDLVPRNGRATAKLRPDLRVAAVHAPPRTLTTRRVDVTVDLEEALDDNGATANLTLLAGGVPIAALEDVEVGAGGTGSPVFRDVLLDSAARATLTVRIEDAAPAEFDVANNEGETEIDVTEHELVRSNVLLDALGGFGAQFNQHVYATITPKPPGSLPDLEAKVKALEPQLVRIFFHEIQERDPDQLASFYETVELAHAAGATINITYHTAFNAKFDPPRFMRMFADVLEELVVARGLTGVRWATIQNEPNTTAVTHAQYEALHRALDAELRARGLRDQIGLMGGDLVEAGHIPWWTYMAENMSDVLDAYSVHIYWNYWDLPRMQFRLRNVRAIVDGPLLEGARKPIYVMEFGVRGIQNIPGLPAIQPGYWEDGTPLSRTNIVAFQHLWFGIASAQLGYSGAVKWDAYWGRYTPGYRETYNLIGPAEEGWPLFPAYHALNLLFQTTERGWQVVRIGPWENDDWEQGVPDPAEKELAAFIGPNGRMSVLGLDSAGRGLNATSTETRSYSVGGLPESTAFTLALWNAAGDGKNSIAGTVTTNAAGVARFEVPLHAAFSLTTLPVS